MYHLTPAQWMEETKPRAQLQSRWRSHTAKTAKALDLVIHPSLTVLLGAQPTSYTLHIEQTIINNKVTASARTRKNHINFNSVEVKPWIFLVLFFFSTTAIVRLQVHKYAIQFLLCIIYVSYIFIRQHSTVRVCYGSRTYTIAVYWGVLNAFSIYLFLLTFRCFGIVRNIKPAQSRPGIKIKANPKTQFNPPRRRGS